jgi:CMP-N,N'-diacetyllegionaminic acid synthase
MNILITICARGGSKGIPGKNIKQINGKPLIAYTIELAKQVREKLNANISISTDDSDIKNVAESFGITTKYNRPASLATDQAGKIDTIRDLLRFEEEVTKNRYEYILDLDVTSPLRNIYDIQESFNIISKNKKAETLFSVNPANRNPYFNMVEENRHGFYSLVKTNLNGSLMTRQSAPKVFDLNASFYWYKRSFFESDSKTPITQNSLIYEMPHVCFDLDHRIDFDFMEYLLLNNKLDFSL